MPRPKGSKNKKKAATVNVDYATQISEKQAAKADLTQQIESKTEELAALKTELKTLNAQVKSLDKEIAKLETAQAAHEAAEAEAAQKAAQGFFFAYFGRAGNDHHLRFRLVWLPSVQRVHGPHFGFGARDHTHCARRSRFPSRG